MVSLEFPVTSITTTSFKTLEKELPRVKRWLPTATIENHSNIKDDKGIQVPYQMSSSASSASDKGSDNGKKQPANALPYYEKPAS
jgi:aspartate/tyrosine/aromatic aminotransferase